MFERLDERRELLFDVRQGRSILMLAPRRVGKTWLMKRFAEDLRGRGWLAVLCDVEGMSRETDFLRHLCHRIEDQEGLAGKAEGRARQIVNQFFSTDNGDGWQQALVRTDWASFAETLVRGLDARNQDTLILVDELALFVRDLLERDARAAKEFLYGLRALQQRYPKVRWLLTGSIGLDTIARRGEIGGALVNFTLFPVEPFGRDAARAFLDHLSAAGRVRRPFTLDDAAFTRLGDELGWLAPYYLEEIAKVIRPSGPRGPDGRSPASVQDVDAAFDAMLAPERRTYFVTWEEHLAKNFPREEAEALRLVLDICAHRPAGERFDTLFARLGGPPWNLGRRDLRDLLTVLTTDGYLSRTEDGDRRFRFRSGLLRRYWLRYHAE
ncbi:MAG TPA: hypothetical protein VK943_10005 [Arenibaculum sp.]|nr:hypothetical protein [Arenibaculum sp.]